MDLSPGGPPAPLTRLQSAWRYGCAIIVGALIWIESVYGQYDGHLNELLILDLGCGALGVVLMRWRRQFPLPVALAVNILGGFSTSASGAAALTAASLATRRRWREIIPMAAVVFVASLLYYHLHPAIGDTPLGAVLFSIFCTIAFTATGMYIGARRDLLATRQERAERASREQQLRVAQGQAAERARIAREMHDVLAHRLSLVAVHAGALSYRRGLTEAEVAESADVIRENAHHALADLREILGVLRTPEATAPPDRPQPTMVDLPALLAEARTAGTNVRLHDAIGDLAEIPATIGRSAYRMIQESLTNARKHAPDTSVDVVLEGGAGGQLVVEVRNPLRVGAVASVTPGSGLGLVGLTERAELIGGHLEHSVRDGEFVLRASLPWPA
jgi:signal transduction histidine kinase